MGKNEDSVFYFHIAELKAKKNTEEERYEVQGRISHPDIDLVDDVMTYKCQEDMTAQTKTGRIKLDHEHEAFRKREGESEENAELNKTINPLGRIEDGLLDEEGATYIKAVLNPNWIKTDSEGNITKTFNQVWQEIEDGFLDAFSVAFVPEQTRVEEINGKTIRLLDKVRLLNVALTGLPVQPKAEIETYGVQQAFAKSLKFMEERQMAEEKNQMETMNSELQNLKGEIEEVKNALKELSKNSKGQEENSKEGEEKSQSQDKKSQEDNSKTNETQEETEVKSVLEGLKEELKSIKEQHQELKDKLKEPIYKSRVEGQESQGQEEKSQDKQVLQPLDLL